MTHSRIIFVLLLATVLAATVSPSFAQFNIRSNAIHIESRKDSIKFKDDNANALNLSLYNDAYDTYLRRMRFRKYNTAKLETSLTFNQNHFGNWVAGGSNTISLRAHIVAEHKYTRKIFNIVTNLSTALGMQITGGVTSKNEDWLNISTTPSWRFANRWSVSGSLIFKTGMLNSYKSAGSSELASTFLSPAQIMPAAGISYKSKNGILDLYFAPISSNLTLITNVELANRGGFGIPAGDRFGGEVGSFFRLVFNQTFFKSKWLTYGTRLESFIRYNAAPTLWWENNVSIKVTRVLGAKLYVLAIYDDRIDTPQSKLGVNNFLQINQTFGFGITYNIQSKKYNDPPENFVTKARDPKLQRKRWID